MTFVLGFVVIRRLMVDVPITVNIPCANQIFQKETTPRPCDVLDRNFHGTEFIEFIVFDVLAMDTGVGL